MITLLVQLICWFVTHSPIDRPKRINDSVQEGFRAYQNKNYSRAKKQFQYLVDSLWVSEPNARLNLGHASFHNLDSAHARKEYERLDSIPNRLVRSIALHQLGVLASNNTNDELALNHFKKALLMDPLNEEARYNFELLKKKKRQQQQETPQQKEEQASPYAKRLKAQAEQLVRQRLYRQAYELMANGEKKDRSVSAFKEFTNRVKKVAEINK